MQGYADEIDLAGNRAVIRIVSVTKTAAESESAVVRKTVLGQAQSFRFRGADHVNV